MVYHKSMIDSLLMASYTLFIIIFMMGMVALGWFGRGIVDDYYRRQKQPSEPAPILQPTYAIKPPPPPFIQPIPQPITAPRTSVSKFPSPAEVRARKSNEAVSSYLESFLHDERRSGSFSIEKELVDS